jgi:3'(2'), 5'-bisphosphate nucleotidase
MNSERLPLLSEEGKKIPYDTRKAWDCYWLVDPIDGTKEFVKRNGEFTVNIALIKERPVAGVVFVPVKGAYYFAAEGLGSYYLEQDNFIAELEGNFEENTDEATINSLFDAFVAASVKLPMIEGLNEPLYVIGSRSHASPKLDDFIETISKKYGEIEVISAGSSLKFCLVAEGKADVYPRFGLTSEWDTGAGQIVAEEADCVVLNMETNKPMEYNKENLLNPFFIIKKNALDI